jgi:hypothetical protein
MNLLWLVLALTQRWYYLLPLYFFVSAADSITGNFADIFHTICLFPVPSNTYACRVLNSRSNETDNYVSAVDAGYKTLHDLLSRPFESSLTNHLAEAQISIDDAVFLVKSSKMDCHMQMVEEFNRLEMESKEVNDELVDFRAQSLGATDL